MRKMARRCGVSSPTKKGGSRAKPDEYPLGVCGVCGEGRRSTWGPTCPQCGSHNVGADVSGLIFNGNFEVFYPRLGFNGQINKSVENRGTKHLKIKSKFWRALVLLISIFSFTTPKCSSKAETETDPAHRIATAVRIKGTPPQLDGVLDDDIWKTAPLHEGFPSTRSR